jgi:hypothetical protein
MNGSWTDDKQPPERIRQNLSNVKSVLRKRGRKRARRKEEEEASPARPVKRRHTMGSLEALEEHIEEALTIARVLDRDVLHHVIQLLRRAPNEVVWKLGQ